MNANDDEISDRIATNFSQNHFKLISLVNSKLQWKGDFDLLKEFVDK